MLVAVVELVKLFPTRLMSRSETEETDVSYNDGCRLLPVSMLLILLLSLLLLLFPLLFDAEKGRPPLLLVDGDDVGIAIVVCLGSSPPCCSLSWSSASFCSVEKEKSGQTHYHCLGTNYPDKSFQGTF